MEVPSMSVISANGQTDWTPGSLDGHLYASSGLNKTLGDDDDDEEQDFASRLYSFCLQLLQYLCRQEQRIAWKRHMLSAMNEELGKLYLWGEAFKNGKLDRALEYSDDVLVNVLDSLGDIGELILHELWAFWAFYYPVITPRSRQKSIQELKYLVKQAKSITTTRNHTAEPDGDWAEESDIDEETSSDDHNIIDIVEELRLQTQWLAQLSPVLEQNLVSAQKSLIRASRPAPVQSSVSGPAETYVSSVRERYDQAQVQLVERLGEVNRQRHMSIRKSMKAPANDETQKPPRPGPRKVALKGNKVASNLQDLSPTLPSNIKEEPESMALMTMQRSVKEDTEVELNHFSIPSSDKLDPKVRDSALFAKDIGTLPEGWILGRYQTDLDKNRQEKYGEEAKAHMKYNGVYDVFSPEQATSSSLQKSATVNAPFNPMAIRTETDDAVFIEKPRKLKPMRARKARSLTDEGKAHAKAVRECPGAACVDCKRRKTKCTHRIPEDMVTESQDKWTPTSKWTGASTPDNDLTGHDPLFYESSQKEDFGYEDIE